MAEIIDIRALNDRVQAQSGFVTNLQAGMDQVIVGQKHLVESLLVGLLSDGHILLEGVPGLAKTLAIKTLASLISSGSNVFLWFTTSCRLMLTTLPRSKPKTTSEVPEMSASAARSPSILALIRSSTLGEPPL